MKKNDKFIFRFKENTIYTIYFVDQLNGKVSYVDSEMFPGHCTFFFFKEHAIILTPLLEELL